MGMHGHLRTACAHSIQAMACKSARATVPCAPPRRQGPTRPLCLWPRVASLAVAVLLVCTLPGAASQPSEADAAVYSSVEPGAVAPGSPAPAGSARPVPFGEPADQAAVARAGSEAALKSSTAAGSSKADPGPSLLPVLPLVSSAAKQPSQAPQTPLAPTVEEAAGQSLAQPVVQGAGIPPPAASHLLVASADTTTTEGLAPGSAQPSSLAVRPTGAHAYGAGLVSGAAAVDALPPAVLAAAAKAAGWTPDVTAATMKSDPSLKLDPKSGTLVYACSFGHTHAVTESSAATMSPTASSAQAVARRTAGARAAGGRAAAAVAGAAVAAAASQGMTPPGEDDPAASDMTFKLHSRPGAPKIIYLHFKGQLTTGTVWRREGSIESPPFDTGKIPSNHNA